MRSVVPTIFECADGCNSYTVLPADANTQMDIPASLLAEKPAGLPNTSEVTLMRHYIGLSNHSKGVDNLFYPLGSCTMKYNPKVNEAIAALPGFAQAHPLQPQSTVQGSLAVMHLLEGYLAKITGMDAISLQPAAGAHGELTGLLVMKAYHEKNGQGHRKEIIVPDSAHGTNPASATMAGFTVVEIASGADGRVDLNALSAAVGENTAGLMLTNPSTLGLFETDIMQIASIVHEAGGLLYYDGANLNAMMGICRPSDTGFDVVHLNLHKTFSTPHGGGGPGSGPIGVKAQLAEFLPVPRVVQKDGVYALHADAPHSIGKVRSFYGNFGVYLKALAYILSLGGAGLADAAKIAVLNANYLLCQLQDTYTVPFGNGRCMHEFVISAVNIGEDIHATDIAKALIDANYHPPTMYFPLIVKEALMVEPTETETLSTLDAFVAALKQVAKTARDNPDALHSAPITTPVGRLDETAAARNPVLRYEAADE
ncbi:aminomethyl-transferring glycine dehydrogenase subunit GcvPB [Eubacteriales bacterium OttesenSCG-928-N14]|nr:aminomethyl-transferring glycine dehydrogenase subunit GcvPB [Eubacteriales bacterium OttesenSCG-928-N14]